MSSTVPEVTARIVAAVVLEHGVVSYRIPITILTDNRPQFVAKIFAAPCASMSTKVVTTVGLYPQTNGKVERFNKTLVARLRHYIEEHRRSWDVFIQPLKYGYSAQVQRTAKTSDFSLVLSRTSPGATARSSMKNLETLIRLLSD